MRATERPERPFRDAADRRDASARGRPRSFAGSACTRGAARRSCGCAGRSTSSACASCRSSAVAARLLRERGLGPWSLGVVCAEGLGSYERGLVGDLGLLKLCKALHGRWVEAAETAELLEPYDEWQGLASVYLLRGFSRGLIPLPERGRAPDQTRSS